MATTVQKIKDIEAEMVMLVISTTLMVDSTHMLSRLVGSKYVVQRKSILLDNILTDSLDT